MLTLKCSACGSKLLKYEKIGKGELLVCHKSRITKLYKIELRSDGKLCCKCGQEFVIDADAAVESWTKQKLF